MENASKALLMAGAILISIIIIGLFIKEYGIIVSYKKNSVNEEEQKQIAMFNEQFTQYLGKYIYGTDVITNINKIQNLEYIVKIKISFTNDGYTYETESSKSTIKDIEFVGNDNTDIINSVVNSSEFKNKAFQCSKIEYDSTTGRVNSITFVEKSWE